jgi:hypothetical protein
MNPTRQKLSDVIANIKWKAAKRLRAIYKRDPNFLAEGLREALGLISGKSCFLIPHTALQGRIKSSEVTIGDTLKFCHEKIHTVIPNLLKICEIGGICGSNFSIWFKKANRDGSPTRVMKLSHLPVRLACAYRLLSQIFHVKEKSPILPRRLLSFGIRLEFNDRICVPWRDPDLDMLRRTRHQVDRLFEVIRSGNPDRA